MEEKRETDKGVKIMKKYAGLIKYAICMHNNFPGQHQRWKKTELENTTKICAKESAKERCTQQAAFSY